ncbi:MAG: hypothetical protein V1793_07600 [Pseudomonadota bacterium]
MKERFGTFWVRVLSLTVIALSRLISLLTVAMGNAASESKPPFILILDAYHQGEDWSDADSALQ